ncbi:sirohydrochlorin cobaltochelatase [mine drainage metagenome]|uniref:Sirohydrochlorin cobaltochelatase n=1 Tax=mine drainage metagenome TaxID=410659 RepID=A0A1J5QMK5_9ZZZZ
MERATFHGPAAGPALLVVGHGTKSTAGVAQFMDQVDQIRSITDVDVAGGFIELSSPPLTDTVAQLVAAGHRKIVAVPLVLVAAGHSKGDIPAALKRESLRHPGLAFDYGRSLSGHPTILNLLTERLDAVLAANERSDTAVLLVGRGTTDPDANADVARVARLFWEGRSLQMVEPSFVSLAEPSVIRGLERCRLLGARRIVVLPYFLFSGILPDRVIEQALGWGNENDEIELRFAELLGDCLPLAELVLERYAEALAGHVRVNCDTCLYRVALPGFESRVGADQHPHDHPLDHAH